MIYFKRSLIDLNYHAEKGQRLVMEKAEIGKNPGVKIPEDALSEALDLNQKIISTSRLGILAYRASGECVLANQAAEGFVGAPQDQLLAQNFHQLESWKRSRLYQMALDTLETGDPQQSEINLQTTFGKHAWWDCTMNVFTSRGEKHLLVVFLDITARKQAESALADSEERYRSLFHNKHTPMLLIDPGTARIIDANPAAAGFYGWSQAELTEMKITDINLLPPGETYRKMDLASLAESNQEFIFQHRLANGEIRSVEVHSGPIHLRGSLYLFSIISDITDRLKAEAALQDREMQLADYAARLRRSNQELEQFAFIASHDLQEPLRKIEAFGELLRHGGAEMTADQRDYLERIHHASVRMRHMTSSLLDLSRVTTQGLPFEWVDLNQTIAEVLADLEIQIQRSNGKIEVGQMPAIQADPDQIRQLMQNLIGNALKYHRQDVPPHIQVSGEVTPEKQVHIRVVDNGIGFEESKAEIIFQPFQRLVSRSEYEGSGMGLAICRKIVERHGGKISAHSLKDRPGSEFCILLPITHTEEK